MRPAFVALGLVSALFAQRANACGVSGPDGLWACSLDEHKQSVRPKWHTGVSGVYTSTALRFSGHLRADETRLAALARLGYSLSPDVTLNFGAGSTFGGRLSLPDGPHEFSPGIAAQVGASWHIVKGLPFVMLTSLLSFSAATTRLQGNGDSTGYQAFDLRLGAIAGVTLLNVLSPYALARVFGGPVYWRYQGASITGTDVSHYQIGAGVAMVVARQMEVFAEGVPLGERAVAAGLSLAF